MGPGRGRGTRLPGVEEPRAHADPVQPDREPPALPRQKDPLRPDRKEDRHSADQEPPLVPEEVQGQW